MTNLKPGDRVDCRIKASEIVGPYCEDYDEIKTFEIIGVDPFGYYLYIPPYLTIKDSTKADKYVCKRLGIAKKYIDDDIYHIREGLIARVSMILDGCTCIKCSEFCPKAEPNQEDGTLICWACRNR